MEVRLIDKIDDFDNLRQPWEEIFSRDQTSSIFTSWAWFRGWLQETPCHWKILTFRSNALDKDVAFFALGFREITRKRIKFSEIFIGGNPNSDHTGFVCLPEHRDEVIRVMVSYLTDQVKWDVFRLKDVLDAKVDRLARTFASGKFHIQQENGQACPYIDLPETWEMYLKNCVGKKRRSYFRRYCRDFDHAEEYRVEIADNKNFDDYLAILLDFYRKRWPHVADSSIDMKRAILKASFETETVMLSVLFYTNLPIAAQVDFVDRRNMALSCYNLASDSNFAELSPGTRLQCYVIRYAIENKFKCYDFLRGGEDYKQNMFGAKIRFNKDIVVYRRNARNFFERCLDVIGTKTKGSSGKSVGKLRAFIAASAHQHRCSEDGSLQEIRDPLCLPSERGLR